jgi:Na+-translocating ferredoxin:NAD+ oxidoreductase RnfG subunit
MTSLELIAIVGAVLNFIFGLVVQIQNRRSNEKTKLMHKNLLDEILKCNPQNDPYAVSPSQIIDENNYVHVEGDKYYNKSTGSVEELREVTLTARNRHILPPLTFPPYNKV